MSNQTEILSMSVEEVDAFLAAARQEVADNTFDTTDGDRLHRMVECMGDTRGMVRLGFADSLGRIGKPAVPFLVDALLKHENPVVRRASAKTLTLIADPDSVDSLVQALVTDEDTVVQGSSVGALARIGEASVPVLLDLLKSPTNPESMKGHAAWALAFIGAEAREYLHKEINSDSESVRGAIVGAIAKLAQEKGEAESFELLIKALKDPAENVRCEAAAVLANLTHKPAVPQLIEMLGHPEGETRKAAALSLMKIKDQSALSSLTAAWEQEPEESLKPIMKLAVTQLERSLDEDDDY